MCTPPVEGTASTLACILGNRGGDRVFKDIGADGNTLLNLAIDRRNSDAITYLIASCGADIIQPTSSGITPLFLAAYRGELDVVRDILNMLIKRGVTAFRTQLETVCTPPGGQGTTQSTTLACILGNRGGDRVFKDIGADGNTLLSLAIDRRNSDAITYLIASCGADIIQPTSSGITPLFLAAYRGELDVVRDILNMLIKRGGTAFRTQLETVCTPPGGQGTTQSTTLACILGNGGGDRVFKDIGADGNTLLNLAIAWRNGDASTYLRASCGADIIQPTSSGITPLFLAAYRGELDVVRDILNMLIERGETAFRTQLKTVCTPPGGQGTTQSTTLACILGNRDGDRVFKNAGADGNTLLKLATAWGNSDAITYLRASCGVA